MSLIKQSIRNIIMGFSPAAKALAAHRLLWKGTSDIIQSGWLSSYCSGSPVDESGRPLPWYTISAIRFLSKRVPESAVVFEYGCGNSTMWWATNSIKVDAVEHDEAWYERIKSTLPDNVVLMFRPISAPDAYSNAISETNRTYDIVIIDGRERVRCSKVAVHHMTHRGVIVWDNSHRERYATGLDALTASGFRSVDFDGITLGSEHQTRTTIFYRDGNLLGL